MHEKMHLFWIRRLVGYRVNDDLDLVENEMNEEL